MILLLFGAAFGSYKFDWFDVYEEQPIKKYIGHIFLIMFIFINLILLLNMLIAMMSDTYAMMGEMKKGIYNF